MPRCDTAQSLSSPESMGTFGGASSGMLEDQRIDAFSSEHLSWTSQPLLSWDHLVAHGHAAYSTPRYWCDSPRASLTPANLLKDVQITTKPTSCRRWGQMVALPNRRRQKEVRRTASSWSNHLVAFWDHSVALIWLQMGRFLLVRRHQMTMHFGAFSRDHLLALREHLVALLWSTGGGYGNNWWRGSLDGPPCIPVGSRAVPALRRCPL